MGSVLLALSRFGRTRPTEHGAGGEHERSSAAQVRFDGEGVVEDASPDLLLGLIGVVPPRYPERGPIRGRWGLRVAGVRFARGLEGGRASQIKAEKPSMPGRIEPRRTASQHRLPFGFLSPQSVGREFRKSL